LRTKETIAGNGNAFLERTAKNINKSQKFKPCILKKTGFTMPSPYDIKTIDRVTSRPMADNRWFEHVLEWKPSGRKTRVRRM
jgi:hypothetical protein